MPAQLHEVKNKTQASERPWRKGQRLVLLSEHKGFTFHSDYRQNASLKKSEKVRIINSILLSRISYIWQIKAKKRFN